MLVRRHSLRFVVAVLVLVYLILACNPYKEPTPGPTAASRDPTSTAHPTLESTPTLIFPTETPTPSPIPAPVGGSLRLYGYDPVTLDPALAGDAHSHEYIAKIFSGLVRMSGDLEILPDIAERWEVDDNHTVYTFYLRQDASFHNGRPVTARDVKRSIERACDPATGSRLASSYLGDVVGAQDKLSGRTTEVSGVEVLDDYTLRIRTDASKAYFLAKLTYPTSYVVDWEQVEGATADWWKEANGTGPFRLKQFDVDAVVLHANKDFYRGRPFLDEVIYRLAGGGAVGQYERGQIDVAPVSVADIDRALDPSNPLHADLVAVHSLDTWYLAFNAAMPPFDDPQVRLAFAYATNKKALAEVILNKTVKPANGILPPDMPGYNDALKGILYDPDRALELLDESRYADGLPPIVFTVSGEAGVSALDEALAESYRQILGAEIEIQQMSWPLFLEGLDDRQFQMFTLGWVADYPDPENFLDLLFHSRSEYNHMAYSNPQVDALLKEARTEPDRGTRLSLYQQAEEKLVWDAAWIPLYHGIDYQLVKPYVKGLVLSPQGFYFLENVVVEPH
ncbi:MAG: peptide ABC transporter substrate-binding protein [Anaerolineae bacterium]|nr:MAG: peptide ABC transporter substrate-binding protein [Anaerolineae bacterium]